MIVQLFRGLCSPRLFIVALILISFLNQGNRLHGAGNTNVGEVMAMEAKGKAIDRREALAKETDNMAQWQSGRILIDGKWQDMRELSSHAASPQIEAYVKKRDEEKLDIEGHRRMARWCAAHKMPETAAIHWKAVLAVELDDEQAHTALKHKRIDNKWLTPEEFTEAEEEQDQEEKWLKQWMPQIKKMIANLESSSAQQKITGAEALEAIDSEAAVPALKYAAMQLEPTMAVPIVAQIKSIRSYGSCLALLEIALQDPNSQVGRSAVEGLKEYDYHFYVPELLQMLEMPVELKQDMFYMPNGALVVRRAYLQETVDEKKQTEILRLVSMPTAYVDQAYLGMLNNPLNPASVFLTENAQMKSSMNKLIQQESHALKQQNELEDLAKRAGESKVKVILANIAGLPFDLPANAFWDWWPHFNEQATGLKNTSYHQVVDARHHVHAGVGAVVRPSSCLIAGTPIQAIDGPKAVDQFQVGDFVVSMDQESGEITSRPVTYVSERTADATFLIKLASGEEIRATGGHNWWITGHGWKRSRELVAGELIRTGDASIEISSVKKIEAPIKVYNLYVDQTHTYFAGNARLLSWDVSSLQPTLQTVPGQSPILIGK